MNYDGPGQVIWIWDDGWFLVRPTTVASRLLLLKQFRQSARHLLPDVRQRPLLFLYDPRHCRSGIMSFAPHSADSSRAIDARFSQQGRLGGMHQASNHFFSLAEKFSGATKTGAEQEFPGHCPLLEAEAELLLGLVPSLFTTHVDAIELQEVRP